MDKNKSIADKKPAIDPRFAALYGVGKLENLDKLFESVRKKYNIK